jgi:hypothetical protein
MAEAHIDLNLAKRIESGRKIWLEQKVKTPRDER